MDPVALTIGTSWTLTGVILVALCIPLVRGHIPRNSWYGIRLPQSFASDDAWYAINRFGAKRMIVWAIPLILVGLVSFFLPLKAHTNLTLFMGFAPLIFVLIPVFESWRFARKYQSRM